jgi:CHAT domain-containing protein/tetratricopeptide (TPR) repeat protein
VTSILAAVLALVHASGPVRPLSAGAAIHDSLSGGGRAEFAISIPALTAARVVVQQDGIDVAVTLGRAGNRQSADEFDFVSGPAGEEVVYPPVLDSSADWIVVVSAALPHAAPGGYRISVELAPADDRSRAIADAFTQFTRAAADKKRGDGAGYLRARDGFAAAAAAAQAAGEPALAAEATFQSALAMELLGDLTGSIERHTRALEMFRQLGRADREAHVLNRLGDQSRKIGEAVDSQRYFDEALPLAWVTPDPAAIADILNNSALLISAHGRFEEGIDRFKEALPLARDAGADVTELAITANIAENYRFLGFYDKSLESYRDALKVAARVNLPRRTALTYRMLAQTHLDRGDRAEAERLLRASLPLWEQSGDRTGEAVTLSVLGQSLHERGDTDGAVALFARALPELRAGGTRGSTETTLIRWASIDIERGDTQAALTKLDEALAITRAIRDPDDESEILYMRARALQKQGKPDEAVESIGAALDIVETLRNALQRSELRTTYLARVRGYFDLAVDLLQQRGDAAAAFRMSERGHARALLEGLAESAAKIEKGVDPALLTHERRLRDELDAKENYRARVALAEGDHSRHAIALGTEVERLLDEWETLQATLRESSPQYWALQSPEPVDAAHVQRTLLDAGTALVEYHLGRDRSYVWVIDRDSVGVRTLPPAASIESLARRFHLALSRDTAGLGAAERQRAEQTAAASAHRLAAAIWAPIEPLTHGKRLLIVPDGALEYVPFAALPAAVGTPLLASHEIVYLPSASVLEALRRSSRPIARDVAAAVFADPVFSINDSRFAAARDASAPSRARASDGQYYGRLRFSRVEAGAILRSSPGALQALDFDATKTAVASRDLRKYGILHFATHGTVNTDRPDLSGLVFSLVDREGKPIDGFLRLYEIYNLDLNADLVVLSACRTALGKQVQGEGLIGLTRGFMYAGASRVVSSIWNVDDRASAELMSRFYDAMLTRNMTPAAALRAAQLSMLHEPRWANPHDWAAFGLHGEWR